MGGFGFGSSGFLVACYFIVVYVLLYCLGVMFKLLRLIKQVYPWDFNSGRQNRTNSPRTVFYIRMILSIVFPPIASLWGELCGNRRNRSETGALSVAFNVFVSSLLSASTLYYQFWRYDFL